MTPPSMALVLAIAIDSSPARSSPHCAKAAMRLFFFYMMRRPPRKIQASSEGRTEASCLRRIVVNNRTVGAALGTIMAIIITHHMTKTSAADNGDHGIGISIGMSAMLVSMPAPVARYIHASATTAASPTATISRSRRSRYSRADISFMGPPRPPTRQVERANLSAASSRNAIRRLYDVGERAVRAFCVELDCPGRVDVGGGNLGGSVLKAIGHHNLNAMGSARHRILDRLDLGLQHALGDNTRDAPVLVE